MRRVKHLAILAMTLSIALAMVPLRSTRADDSTVTAISSPTGDLPDPPKAKAKPRDLGRVLQELDAERKHIDELEQEVKELQRSNARLEQAQSTLQQTDAALRTTNSQT